MWLGRQWPLHYSGTYWIVSQRNHAWLFTSCDLAGFRRYRRAESASPARKVPSGVARGRVEKPLPRLLEAQVRPPEEATRGPACLPTEQPPAVALPLLGS